MTTHVSDNLLLDLAEVAGGMRSAGLPADFIAASLRGADVDEGIAELMLLWKQSKAEERDKIVADIQELLDDAEDLAVAPAPRPRISYKDLDQVVASVREHKQRLRDLIDRHGGVSNVARLAGIPQPSLSRMLNSGSMPRKTTLYKLASALEVSEAEIVGEWTT
jgi:DNA-binding phage protein